MNQLYIDLDGVLADFDGGFRDLFGRDPNRDVEEPPDLWERIHEHGSFFESLAPLNDAFVLWSFVKSHNPIILTGAPASISNVADQKRKWVANNIGDVPVIVCKSKDKSKHCKAGDILVDDWIKYKHLWEGAGGVWITHTAAETSIEQLKKLGYNEKNSTRR